MHISLYSHTLDTLPQNRSVTFDELAALLTLWLPTPPGGKADLPAWSPAQLAGARRAANVVDLSCFVLDVDDGTTIEQGRALWPGLARIMHTSWSHHEMHPKFRLVFPLAQPCPRAKWEACWYTLAVRAKAAGIRLDEKCKNPDRIYYLPAVSPESPYRTSDVRPGAYLTLDYDRLTDPDAVRRRVAAQRVTPIRWRAPGKRDYLDPVVREDVAKLGGFEISDNRAIHGECPRCSRRSVWYFITPTNMAWASCNHRATCGWRGPLAMLDRNGATTNVPG